MSRPVRLIDSVAGKKLICCRTWLPKGEEKEFEAWGCDLWWDLNSSASGMNFPFFWGNSLFAVKWISMSLEELKTGRFLVESKAMNAKMQKMSKFLLKKMQLQKRSGFENASLGFPIPSWFQAQVKDVHLTCAEYLRSSIGVKRWTASRRSHPSGLSCAWKKSLNYHLPTGLKRQDIEKEIPESLPQYKPNFQRVFKIFTISPNHTLDQGLIRLCIEHISCKAVTSTLQMQRWSYGAVVASLPSRDFIMERSCKRQGT